MMRGIDPEAASDCFSDPEVSIMASWVTRDSNLFCASYVLPQKKQIINNMIVKILPLKKAAALEVVG